MTSISESSRPANGSRVDLPAGGGDTSVSSPPRRRRRGLGWAERLEIVALTGPATIVFLAFVMFPVAMAAYYGFFRWEGYGVPTDFIGFQNYITIIKDPIFHDALKHNAFIVVMSLVLQGPAALLLALLMNRKMRGQSVIRVLIFVPYVISEVVVGTGWSLMLQSAGAVNDALEKIGLGFLANEWLSDPDIAIWTLMLIITWKYIGFAVIIFLAGLQGIPQEIYEAAQIDGASYWQIQRRITLPLLGPTIRIWAFLSMIGSLQVFDVVWLVTTQAIRSLGAANTMATYMVSEGFLARSWGYGSAVSVILFVISFGAALLYQRFVLRRDLQGALTERS